MWKLTSKYFFNNPSLPSNENRWEFDKKRLFEKTNHMAKICQDLKEVAEVLDQFHQFLGPELRAVTGDSHGIEKVSKRVESLVEPLDSIPFDIFDSKYKTRWDNVMATFRELVIDIEVMTKGFIDSSFQKLRSAEGAFELLQKFKAIKSRESINKQMAEKFDDILLQYSKEVEVISELFHNDKSSPPTFKNFPPVAGSIAWARSLYHRVKKPILRFKTMKNLLESEKGTEAKEKYLVLARAIDVYIKERFEQWNSVVPETATSCLKFSILGPVVAQKPGEPYKLGPVRLSSSLHCNNFCGLPQRFFRTYCNAFLVVFTFFLLVPDLMQMPYFVNFSPKLSLIIRESKHLDRMGFEIPEAALNVTLQEDKYHEYVQQLNAMLRRYDTVLSELTPVETSLLSAQISKLQKALKPGFEPFNWNSLHIPTFYQNCNHAINEFQNMVSQVKKSSMSIEEVISTVAKMRLVRLRDFDTAKVLEIGEVYEKLENNRTARLESLVHKYKSIGSLLLKVEEVVANTNTGSSPVLAGYYQYWEKKMFNAITEMVICSLTTFQVLLNVPLQLGGGRTGTKRGRQAKRPPICRILATMNAPEIVVNPAPNDVMRYLHKAMKHVVESSLQFTRWMKGTCIQCEPVPVKGEEEPVTFSFYTDVSKNEHIKEKMYSLSQSIHGVFNIVQKYLDSWKRYDTVHGLWDSKRQESLDNAKEMDSSLVYFDLRMMTFDKLSKSVAKQKTLTDIDFLQVDCSDVAIQIAARAREWKGKYSTAFRDLSFSRLSALRDKFAEIRKDIAGEKPKDLDSLKYVLNVIASLIDSRVENELACSDIMERYRTLEQ